MVVPTALAAGARETIFPDWSNVSRTAAPCTITTCVTCKTDFFFQISGVSCSWQGHAFTKSKNPLLLCIKFARLLASCSNGGLKLWSAKEISNPTDFNLHGIEVYELVINHLLSAAGGDRKFGQSAQRAQGLPTEAERGHVLQYKQNLSPKQCIPLAYLRPCKIARMWA